MSWLDYWIVGGLILCIIILYLLNSLDNIKINDIKKHLCLTIEVVKDLSERLEKLEKKNG